MKLFGVTDLLFMLTMVVTVRFLSKLEELYIKGEISLYVNYHKKTRTKSNYWNLISDMPKSVSYVLLTGYKMLSCSKTFKVL